MQVLECRGLVPFLNDSCTVPFRWCVLEENIKTIEDIFQKKEIGNFYQKAKKKHQNVGKIKLFIPEPKKKKLMSSIDDITDGQNILQKF